MIGLSIIYSSAMTLVRVLRGRINTLFNDLILLCNPFVFGEKYYKLL